MGRGGVLSRFRLLIKEIPVHGVVSLVSFFEAHYSVKFHSTGTQAQQTLEIITRTGSAVADIGLHRDDRD